MLLVLAAPLAPGRAHADAAATNTQIMLFNLTPGGTYNVTRNGAAAGSPAAGASGALVYDTSANPGDRFSFLLAGVNPVSPSAPTGFVATGGNSGCVSVSWNPPAGSEYVTDYSLLWGTGTGAYSDSVRINGSDISKGATWTASQCGFATGSYRFALRAHNAFDRWSALSGASTTSISNELTQGPVPPTNVKVTESTFGCAAASWTKSGDPSVTGYRVYFGTHPRSQAAYTDSVEAGNSSQAQTCGLVQGTYYFAVRAYTGVGVMSAYSSEASLSARGVDNTEPSITQRAPAPGATGVALNATIFFVATDDKTGVDPASIRVQINGAGQSVSTSPVAGGYAVQCTPPQNFAPDADVEITLNVADLATPANVATLVYSFHTGSTAITDTDAPVVTAVSPADGAQGVEPRPDIDVRVADAGLGVDFSSVVMEVNGDAVAFTVEGDPADAHLRYRPVSPFAAESHVHVHVEACDRAVPANCAAALDYEFTVRALNAALEGHGAIVPDGFWANDPTRPLEVRDLPAQWTVRIFDTAGASVRSHRNLGSGDTWTWNFCNDAGHRVAPALYLVRVIDAHGEVQRSGRFLVQSPR